jgi:drug/metabolite transporter (DMT)-like permease
MPALSAATATPTHRWGAYLLLTTSMALVGSYVALSKPLVAAIPLFALAFLRFAIAAAAMLPWSLPRADEARLTVREQRLFFAMSFFGNFLFSICMLAGVALSSATAAGVIMATIPAAVAVGARLFLSETLSPRALLAVALAVGGIVLLQFARAGDGAAPQSALLGNLLLFGAVLCEATYVLIGKRLAAVRSPLRVSALINLWGLALMTPLGLWQLTQFDLSQVTASSWLLLLFYSLAASLFAVWLWMAGLRQVPAHQAGVFTVALPLAATAVGVLLLGESFSLLHGVALALACAGVLLIATR